MIMLVAASGATCGSDEAPPVEAAAIAVTVQAARVETLRDTLSAPGTIVPSALADLTVVASQPAEILEIPKAEGAAVSEGDVLVRFEIPALTGSLLARQADVTDATLRVETARAEALRLSALFDQGIVPRNSVDAARTALTAAEGLLTQAKVALDAAKTLASGADVRARFAGVVTKVWHQAGDSVRADPADPILRIIDPARTQVAMQAPAADVDRLMPGLSATVTTADGATEAASVSSRSAPAGGAAEVRLSFLAQSALAIDTPVQVEVLIDERRDVVVAPAPAVVREAGNAYIWIARPDGRAERRDVRVGLTVRGLAQVLSGVTAGEEIITTGLAQLQDGVAITVSR
jgi:RND family efflux transporter MFP subunit